MTSQKEQNIRPEEHRRADDEKAGTIYTPGLMCEDKQEENKTGESE